MLVKFGVGVGMDGWMELVVSWGGVWKGIQSVFEGKRGFEGWNLVFNE